MASSTTRPREVVRIERPRRGQVVWWVVGGVVAAAAFTAAALAASGHPVPGAAVTDGAGTAPVTDLPRPAPDAPALQLAA